MATWESQVLGQNESYKKAAVKNAEEKAKKDNPASYDTLSDSAKKLVDEWSTEKLTQDQVDYNRKHSLENIYEKARYDKYFAGTGGGYPEFHIDNGKVKVTGPTESLNAPVVDEASKVLQNYFKGKDLSNKQIAENFQKSLDLVNKQMKSQLQYQEYANFLDKSGYSDQAYRNYATAKTVADLNTTTNPTKSKDEIWSYDKNGELKKMTIKEWFDYWKTEYTPEERVKLWMDSGDALGKAETDEDLYKAMPFLLMGVKTEDNIPASFLNRLNPFDENANPFDDQNVAKVNAPVYGFDDVNGWDQFWDAFASTNKEAFYRLIGKVGGATTPTTRFLGSKYIDKDISDITKWGEANGLGGVTREMIEGMTRDDWNKAADLVNKYFGSGHKSVEGNSADILERDLGKQLAAQVLWVRDMSPHGTAIGSNKKPRDIGWENFEKYKEYTALMDSEGYKSPYEKWGKEREAEMTQHLTNLSILAPNATTWGVIGGTLARQLAEQVALGLVSGGALTASNIAKTLTEGGWKLGSKALTSIGLGQKLAASSPSLAATVHAMAVGGQAGTAIAKGAGAASSIIYGLGNIATWAVRELGEDVLRGLVDDTVTANSFDSQGNLDPNKLMENVYMNAVMWAGAKGIKGAFKGLASIVDNAKTRNIDGVELSASRKADLKLIDKALDKNNTDVIWKGLDDNKHPVVIDKGVEKVLDKVTASDKVAKAIEETTGVAAPTVARTIEDVVEDENIDAGTRQKITDVVNEKVDTTKAGWQDDFKTKLQETLSDDEIRQAFPDGTIKVGDDTIKIDTKEFLSGDINRVGGQNFKTMDDAIDALNNSNNTRDFVNAINGVMRNTSKFADNWANAVKQFADAHDMTVKQVMQELFNSKRAGVETIPGLYELWETNWKNAGAERLLNIEEQITGHKVARNDFYQREMLAGTVKPKSSGAWEINNSPTVEMLGGDASFDLSASSTAHNTGKLAELAGDNLEYDPKVLASEYVGARLQSIWNSPKGRVYSIMQEAHEAGEYDITEAEAAKSVAATEKVGRDVDASDGVKAVSDDIDNIKPLGDEFDGIKVGEDGDATFNGKKGAAAVDEAAELSKKEAVNIQKRFNESASKSHAAEEISANSGYKKRGNSVQAGKAVGVNFMPGNPFGKFAKWVNDHFMKANSIKMEWKDANGKVVGSVTAYDGGYKMYAEASTFARAVVVDIQRGMGLWEAVNKQIRNNGFFIQPSDYAIKTYGALDVDAQAAKVTDQIVDKMANDSRFILAFDGNSVRDTDALLSMLTTRFKGQGINDFSKFLRKADLNTFSKEQVSWLNKRMYEMTASVNKKTFSNMAKKLAKFSMGLRYKSNMWFNVKNGQLQLTEIQRLYTMNKIGDFGSTLKRLVSDKDFRSDVSDRTYILAAESMGYGLSRSDLEDAADAVVKLGAGSTIGKNGVITDLDVIKAKYGDLNDSALASIEGAEYAKNYILVAGFLAAGERKGLTGVELDNYVRNRFNVEAIAGNKVGKIGLNDSAIGQFAFMYLGFPIRELTLNLHTIRGGGLSNSFLGSVNYLAKMLGAKGLVWAAEAPWGYTLMDQAGLDPFGFTSSYDRMPNDYEDRTPGWRNVDFIMASPLTSGAMFSAVADIYFTYRAAEETARMAYMEEHDGSDEGFEWSAFETGANDYEKIMNGLAPVGEAALGFIPGRTAYSRIEGEIQDLDRGYRISQTGNKMYETNTDFGNVLWGMLTGRKNTTNAQDYYQTANPIRGLVEGGLPGLGQQIGRANPFRGFREFDPIDSDTYKDWFNGSYQDQQNWNTGVYAFGEEAKAIRDKYDQYGTDTGSLNAREIELADLRERVEKYVNTYLEHHPEGISQQKETQLINIFNMAPDTTTLKEKVAREYGQGDYSERDAAESRYAQGNFPTAYGLTQNKKGETEYVRNPQLEQVLSQQRYGIASEVSPIIEQMYKNQTFKTPAGAMSMKDYHDKVYEQLQSEWNKSKTDYKKVTQIQEAYLDVLAKNVIEPVLNTYGSSVLSAGRSSDIMQEFGKMLYGMIPSDDYRIDKRGNKIYKSTPYMTVDIPAWLRKNFSAYQESVNVTNRDTKTRLKAIQSSLDQGHQSTAKAKTRSLIQDIGKGKASVSRKELEWLQKVLND